MPPPRGSAPSIPARPDPPIPGPARILRYKLFRTLPPSSGLLRARASDPFHAARPLPAALAKGPPRCSTACPVRPLAALRPPSRLFHIRPSARMSGRIPGFRNPPHGRRQAIPAAEDGAPPPTRMHRRPGRYCRCPPPAALASLDPLHLFQPEKEPVARLSQHSQIAAGIILQHDGDVRLSFVIFLHRFDDGPLPAEHHVENVRAAARTEQHDVALLQSAHRCTCRKPRTAPCNFRSCSGPSDSDRSRTSRARSPPARISAFSASESVRIRSVRIS